jgi:hypothetical protein
MMLSEARLLRICATTAASRVPRRFRPEAGPSPFFFPYGDFETTMAVCLRERTRRHPFSLVRSERVVKSRVVAHESSLPPRPGYQYWPEALPGTWGAGKTLSGVWGAGKILAGAWGAGRILAGAWGAGRILPGAWGAG